MSRRFQLDDSACVSSKGFAGFWLLLPIAFIFFMKNKDLCKCFLGTSFLFPRNWGRECGGCGREEGFLSR